jgi:hypothetical protein
LCPKYHKLSPSASSVEGIYRAVRNPAKQRPYHPWLPSWSRNACESPHSYAVDKRAVIVSNALDHPAMRLLVHIRDFFIQSGISSFDRDYLFTAFLIPVATNPKRAPQITLTTMPPMRPAVSSNGIDAISSGLHVKNVCKKIAIATPITA